MSLTEVSYYVRKFLPFVIIFSLLFIIFFYVFKIFFFFANSSGPQITYLNPIFDKIATPDFQHSSSSAGMKFTLDTIEGSPTTATDAAKVFFLPASTTRFGYREKVYVMAKSMGFNTDTVRYSLDGTTATFADGKQTLTVDITNFNFNYEYKYEKDPTLLLNPALPEAQRVEDDARDFLKGVGRYPDELAQGKANVIFFQYNQTNNTLQVVERPQDGNMVEIDFYRPDIDAVPQAIPVVSSTYFNSPDHVIAVYNNDTMRILKASVSFFEKSSDQIGVYPVEKGDVAWQQLTKGMGYIVSNPSKSSSIVIKKMFLGYYDSEKYQEYLQPVYVFLGDGDFVAYVPAITSQYLVTK